MKPIQSVDDVVIRFAGDSGDGMQVTGSQFTNTTALAGNDLSTFPDFPAEIRAPAGTLAGVSGFQIRFSSSDIYTPGDTPAVLFAMNPAALKANIADLKKGGLLVINQEKFTPKDFEKAGLTSNPLDDGSLDEYRLVKVDMARMTKTAIEGLGLGTKEVDRTKNFFALGMAYWLYTRDSGATEAWIQTKFKEPFREANLRAMRAGHAYAETVELFETRFEVPKADLPPGIYRNILGNQALSIGLVVGAQKAGVPLFLGSYPITPASDILHQLAGYKQFGVTTFQAEDEIAAIGSAIGASFGGAMGICTTSGPGMALKAEAIGLAVMTELPLVIIDVQRGGPSTGLPTKTEQSDLMQAMYGRNGEAPVAVIAASTPTDCFDVAVEAVRAAVTHMCPVILLTDGYLANGSEPWKVPDLNAIPDFAVNFRTEPEGFKAYLRNPETLARPWVRPGTPGLEHRIGGIEKAEGTGNVSYDPKNHERMVHIREAKIAAIVVPDLEVTGDPDELLLVGWGSTAGAIRSGVELARSRGYKVAYTHFRWLNPLPRNLTTVLRSFKTVLVPEMNLGQLARILRAQTLVDCIAVTKVQGQAFKVSEIFETIVKHSPGYTQDSQGMEA
ncbi:MAG: 2-oxoacid:acceptor oxidoreductase subunit alpha [Myxococcales bacterium]|nr:2-oxoacid:acceptor oxidoreductase subunit alpha [Myxococcales bacterium]